MFVPDLIAFNAVIVDAKVMDRTTGRERGFDVEVPPDDKAARWNDS